MRILSNLRWWCVLCGYLASFNLQAAGISFEPNLGQTGADIRYLARTSSGVIFITDRGITLSEPLHTVPAFELLDASLSAEWTPQSATGEMISYFVGRDPAKWVRDAPHYARLVRRSVYPGIDLVLYGPGGQLEYDFLLAPQADPSQIRLKITGAKNVSVGADGALVVNTPEGELRHRKPVLMETLPNGSRRNVAGAFRVLGRDEVGFSVEGHDPALALSIDPVLESSTYFGGSADDQVIATDGNGSVAGMTTSIDVPGASFLRRGGTDMFVRVENQVFVFGGSGNETVTSAVFSLLPYYVGGLMAAVAGYTDSTDLPTNISAQFGQPSALQPNYAGGATDGFVLLINRAANGGAVPQLTYLGGPGDDRINAIAIDPNYSTLAIGGDTNGGGLPSPYVFGAAPAGLAGGLDGFVMLAYPNLNQPLYVYSTTYIGGSGDDTISGITIRSNICYATGETKSHDFPLKSTLDAKLNGESDAFVAKIDSGGKLTAGTLFGGSGADRGVAVGVFLNGNIVVAGVTSSTDLPLVNPKQKAYGGGMSDAFVAQFNTDLSKLIASTYLGGSEADEATSVAVAIQNTIFVGGWTASQNFPTVNALQSKYGGGPDDGFLVHFDDDGSIYQSTFFGGSGSDRVLGLAGDSSGAYYGSYTGPTVWLSGVTTSPDFPQKNASQTSLRGSSDGFVAEVTADLFSLAPFTGGKDLRSGLQLYYGNPALARATVFTITSSDPSMVQVSASQTGAGQTSIQFMPQPGSTQVYADCLTDSGSTKLTATAAGYPTRVVQATCVSEAIVVEPPSGSNSEFQTNVGATPGTIGFYQVANDRKSGLLYGAFTRPGATPVTVQISDSNPSVATVSPTSVPLPTNAPQNPVFQPLAIGQTDLTFSAGDLAFLPSNKLHATVGGSVIAPVRFSVPSSSRCHCSCRLLTDREL